MRGYLGHVYSGQVSIIRGYHQASLRFCLGDKPTLLFQEGSLVTFMEADTYNFPSQDLISVDGILITQECFLGGSSAINSSIVISYYLHMNDSKIIGDVLRFGSHILLLSNDESSELDPKISGSHLGMIEKIYLLEPSISVVELMPVLEIDGLELLWRPDPQDYIEGYSTIYFFTPIGRCTIEVANPYIHSIDSYVMDVNNNPLSSMVQGFDCPKIQGSRFHWKCPFVDPVKNEIAMLNLWTLINCFVVGVFEVENTLDYWFSGRSPLMKMSTTTTPCGQGVFKGREMLGI